MKKNQKLALLILDGWGIGNGKKGDAVAMAKTPCIDALYAQYPHSQLLTHGYSVGLPDGQMGNSEVGHINLGAGRVVYQELARINKAVEDRELMTHPILDAALMTAKNEGKAVHLLGLLSDGGVHSHINHLKGLVEACEAKGIERVYIHAFTDGRDVDPQSGKDFVADLEAFLVTRNAILSTICGRYYAMDRDKRWERVRIAYDMLVNGTGSTAPNLVAAIQASYDQEVTDEFIKPILKTDADGTIYPSVAAGDTVICFNFRTDRCREITEVLTQQDMPELGMQTLALNYVTMTRYSEQFKNIKVLFEKDDVTETLGEVLAKNGKTQLRISETEKYPHVTFFFNGGREAAFERESRIMISSPKVATYDLQPEMSAREIAAAATAFMTENAPDFICLNFANADMVGHTGILEAAIRAVETVDDCVAQLLEVGLALDYQFIIIADHGNSDYMINEDGSPNTAHTTNLVPCILVGNELGNIKIADGKLGDIAPTILTLMQIPIPAAMSGNSLVG